MRAVGTAIASFAGYLGAYPSTDPRRKFLEGLKFQRTTANEAISYNLPTLIAQARHIERSTASGRGVVEALKADIVGTGIDIGPDTGDDALNKAIHAEFIDWAECCGINGESLWELQSQACGEWGVAGALLWRLLVLPERATDGHIPLVIQPLEPEWLSPIPVAAVPQGLTYVNGIELDRYGRAVAYHLRDPSLGVGLSPTGERVPAAQVIHGFERRRPLQAHGEPVLAPAIERIIQEQDLVDIELSAARSTAGLAIAITSDYHPGITDDDGSPVEDIPINSTVRLRPGEDAKSIRNERPNQLIDAFRRMLQGDVAAACRIAVKWLRRDYSGATFMNARMEQLDSKRLHKPTQDWFGKYAAGAPYLAALPWILLRIGRTLPNEPRARRQMLRFKLLPDLPEYVDPLKDGEAAAQNVGNNLTTLEAECSARGRDWRKVLEQRAIEKKEIERLGLMPIEKQPAQQQQTEEPADA
jgi:lambda family phage portal protein